MHLTLQAICRDTGPVAWNICDYWHFQSEKSSLFFFFSNVFHDWCLISKYHNIFEGFLLLASSSSEHTMVSNQLLYNQFSLYFNIFVFFPLSWHWDKLPLSFSQNVLPSLNENKVPTNIQLHMQCSHVMLNSTLGPHVLIGHKMWTISSSFFVWILPLWFCP